MQSNQRLLTSHVEARLELRSRLVRSVTNATVATNPGPTGGHFLPGWSSWTLPMDATVPRLWSVEGEKSSAHFTLDSDSVVGHTPTKEQRQPDHGRHSRDWQARPCAARTRAPELLHLCLDLQVYRSAPTKLARPWTPERRTRQSGTTLNSTQTNNRLVALALSLARSLAPVFFRASCPL